MSFECASECDAKTHAEGAFVKIFAANNGLVVQAAGNVILDTKVAHTDTGNTIELQQAPAWMVTLIVGREFAVTALRLVALERGVAISANWLGKAKTTSQIITVSILIFSLNSDRWQIIALVALWITVMLTVASMVVYFWQNRGVITEDTT